MERHHGFFLNDLDPRSGATLKISPIDATPRRPLVSAVDNAWLAAALTMVENVQPALRSKATKLLEAMNFRFFFDPYNAVDPLNHPGQLHVGYWADDQSYYGHYGMLNTEARIASYLGIARGQIPAESYYRLYRTLPEAMGQQEQVPQGRYQEYLGIKVYEGSYMYRGARIVPSWGGSMFEALMVTLFVPEEIWRREVGDRITRFTCAPRSSMAWRRRGTASGASHPQRPLGAVTRFMGSSRWAVIR